jgi:Na+/proline symporter
MMTPHRALYRSSPPKHTVLILAALGCSCLVLSGVTGLASLLGWVAAGIILAGIVGVGALLALAVYAIAARDNALDLPGAME